MLRVELQGDLVNKKKNSKELVYWNRICIWGEVNVITLLKGFLCLGSGVIPHSKILLIKKSYVKSSQWQSVHASRRTYMKMCAA